MKTLARWCFRRRWIVLAAWIVGLAALGAVNVAAGPNFAEDFKLPNTESAKAIDLLTKSAPAQSGETDRIVLHARSGTVEDADKKAAIDKMVADVKTVPHVTSLQTLDEATQSKQVNGDKTIAFLQLQWNAAGGDLGIDNIKSAIHKAQAIDSPNLQVELSGDSIQYASSNQNSGPPPELIGVLAALIVLYLTFRSIFTTLLPIVCAGFAVAAGSNVIGLLTHGFDIAQFGPILATLIGLGVGIDYALFIVSRHRTNLLHGDSPEDAIAVAINTSGRAVLFAGITVCIGICGLLLTGVSFFYGLALSVVATVLLTMLSAVTLLPAFLGFLKMKALSKKQRRSLAENGPVDSVHELSQGWSKWARLVQKHKYPMGAVAIIFLLFLGAPVLGVRLGTTDAGGDPKGSTTRNAYELLAQGFGPGFNGPLQLVAETTNQSQIDAFNAVLERAKTEKNVAAVTPAIQFPGTSISSAQVFPKSKPQDKETTDLISNLRKDVTHPAKNNVTVYITGSTAIFQDFTDVLKDKLPIFIGAVIGLSFILLMTVFRSLLIPLVASFMNLLSAASSFGIVVAIFQWGWGASIFEIQQTGPILSFLPVMAFAILFGLSMDYEVFLVSRMYEEWHATRDNDEAVALGQAETGRVITAAGTIMVVIFVSFVFGDEATIKLFGIALASAVLLDALIVRTIIVPAIMNAIGKANWYLPAWLDRILPKINVEASDVADASSGSHPA